MCGLIDDTDFPKAGKHRELERAEMKKSEEAVQKVISAIQGFCDNPWTSYDNDRLYSLASGCPVPVDIEHDVLNAATTGRAARDKFVQERFVDGSSQDLFFEPIKRLNLKTMDMLSKKVKLTTSQGKVSYHICTHDNYYP